MKSRVFIRTSEVLTSIFVTLFLFLANPFLQAETFLYQDHNIHIRFMLDTESHTASVGDGIDERFNARAYPPHEDPYWTTFENLWKHIVIPDTVVYDGEKYAVIGINWHAFYKQTETKTIQLPNTIRYISEDAFGFSVNLESIIIPEGVEVIGSYAFEICRSLDSITLPSTITSIGGSAFYNCDALKKINIPGNCLSIGDDAFTWCDSLNTLIIEDGTEPLSLGYSYNFGFDWISGALSLHTHATYVRRFYRGQFADCDLRNIYIGRNIIIPDYPGSREIYSPFEECYCNSYDPETNKQFLIREGKRLDKFEFGQTVTRIPDRLLYKCSTKESYCLPPNIQYIGVSSLIDRLVMPIVFPATCDSIGSSSIFGNLFTCMGTTPPVVMGSFGNKTKVRVPLGYGNTYRTNVSWMSCVIIDDADSIVTINVRYPGSLYGRIVYEDLDVTKIYRLKLTGALNASDWEVVNTMTKLYELDISELMEGPDEAGVSLTCPLVYYRGANTVNELTNRGFLNVQLPDTFVVPSTCTKINESTFVNQPTKHIVITGPTILGYKAFSDCDSLRSVEIRAKGVEIISDAFSGAKNVKRILIPKGTYVENCAFRGSHLTDVILEDSIQYLGDYAFSGVPLENVVLGGYFGYFGKDVFTSSRNSLNNLHITHLDEWCKLTFSNSDENPINMASHVFIEGEEIDSLCIPDNITTLNSFAFAGYKNLKKVYFEGNKDALCYMVFNGCPHLEEVVFTNAVNKLGVSAFSNCEKLTSVSFLSEGLITLPDSCFIGDVALQTVKLNHGMQQIGQAAFAGCTSLPTVNLPPTIETIGKEAFEGCEALNSMSFPFSIKTIKKDAFHNCSNLKTLKAHWVEPISIDANIFNGISNRCILWVPYNTAVKYSASGWGHIPLIEEGYYMFMLTSGINGTIRCGDFSASASKDAIVIDMEDVPEEIVLEIEPDSSYYVTSLILDSVDITSQMTLKNNRISISDIQDNHSISARFEKFTLGDVNVDDYVDVGDITSIVNYIRETPVGTFIPDAADVNRDTDIDVGDVVGEVNLIYDLANMSSTNAAPMHRNNLPSLTNNYVYFGDVKISSSQEITIPVHLENNTAVRGFQMEIVLPDGFYIPQDELGSYRIAPNAERLGAMNIYTITPLSNGRYQVLCAATNQACIQGDEGVIVNIILHNESLCSETEYTFAWMCKIADAYGRVYSTNEETSITLSPQAPTSINNPEQHSSNEVQKRIENGCFYILKNGVKHTISGVRVL